MAHTATLTFLDLHDCVEDCNDPEFEAAIKEFIALYCKADFTKELAQRLAKTIYQMKWLWRNKFGTHHHLIVKDSDSGEVLINLAVPMTAIKTPLDDLKLPAEFDTLIAKISDSLKGEELFRISVQGFVRLNFGEDVYPSQEFGNQGQDSGRMLAHDLVDGARHARMHSQKISNQIKAIDTWYMPEPDMDVVEAIPVEPYGVDLLRFGKESVYYILGSTEVNGVYGLLEKAKAGNFDNDSLSAWMTVLRPRTGECRTSDESHKYRLGHTPYGHQDSRRVLQVFSQHRQLDPFSQAYADFPSLFP